MKNILIYTSPARGHLYPMMDVALELKQRGHNVTVQTLSSERKTVTGEGLHHRSISPEIESLPLEDYKEKTPVGQIKSAFTTWLERASHEVRDLNESCSRIDPDLLIVDVNTWGAGAFAEARKRPWLMFMPYCLPIASADTPAFGPGFPPPVNVFHRLRDRLVDGLVRKAVRGHVKGLNKLRAELGVSTLGKYEDIFNYPNLVLYRTAEPFEYSRKNLPAHILPIGPGLWAPKNGEAAWVDELAPPRILISVSTEKQEDANIIKTALRAMTGEKASLIITTSAYDPQQFSAEHDRIRIVKFLSHAQIIDKMDLLVSHGGMGSTQRALAAGVPVCAIPHGRDQRETARRVEVSDSGIMLPANKLDEKQFREAVLKAMDKKPGAEKVARAFVAAGGAKRAVEAIDDFLN